MRTRKNLVRMPDLESFFTFGGTLELLTPIDAPIDPPLEKLDIVISELMWGVDTGVKDTVEEDVPLFLTEEAQWIELYNTTNKVIEAELYLLFTPFISYPNRDVIDLRIRRLKLTLNIKSLTQSAPYISGNGSCREKAAEDRIPPSFLPIAT